MNQKIFPGKPWLDTKGERIEAHGGTMFQENGVYYWLGEDKSHTSKKGKIWTWGIKLYSSTDLYNWKDEGHIISPDTENKESLFYPTRRLDRPHLLKNPNTGKYVLWVKYCDKAHSFATFNSQASCIFQVAGTDQFVMMADRWVPDYVMTDDRYQSFYRVIYCREDKIDQAVSQGYGENDSCSHYGRSRHIKSKLCLAAV